MRELAQTRAWLSHPARADAARRLAVGKERFYRVYTEEGCVAAQAAVATRRPPRAAATGDRATTSGAWTSSPTSSPTADASER